MRKMMNRTIGMKSDIGKTREVDEDSIRAETSECIIKSKMRKVRLLIVADGLGGHQKGEEASKIATESIFREWSKELSNGTPFNLILEQGIQNANQNILDYTSKHPEASGMGTTCVCAMVEGNNVVLANVGDSRAYKISDEIHQVTKDHSYVQQLVDSDEISKVEAREHSRKNEITKAVGTSSSLEVDTMKLTLDSDESLLLCCDGVNDHLSDDKIQKIVHDSPDPDTACEKIVDMVNEEGGFDNISLIILSAEKSGKQVESKSKLDDIPEFFRQFEEKRSSTNGTMVNGKDITGQGKVELENGVNVISGEAKVTIQRNSDG